ncbi:MULTISPECIES: nucleotidyltransferase domain-containing protein [Citrobacter]|uniref:nucleotidyltransferase domain-containing protein n=1 Tax=Citrobacter TaxID=544 RepID=UPI0019059CF5|nr:MULTISPECIES: nucleotidyltransferase [Citrobacter]MBJ9140195.1 nucleotidyltransferase [Citrobacter koseri]MDM2945601.1 nucleotidyltransferase [Citrobacter sp. CK207]
MNAKVLNVSAQDESQISSWERMLAEAARKISLTESQYSMIESRYAQLQNILDAATDPCLSGAHIFIQGSVGLKTTIKPVADAIGDMATIDADAIVLLENAQHYGPEQTLDAMMKLFKQESRVQAEPQELRRGIRIVYADENPGFHIDITPAIKAEKNALSDGYGILFVPDREAGWKVSAPRSYSQWLSEASKAHIHLLTESRAMDEAINLEVSKSRIDPLPVYGEYAGINPLLATIKLLKRHRDEWAIRTKNVSTRPISAVITTLATRAYLSIASRSVQQPLRPIEVMFSIVAEMNQHILYEHGEYLVRNPCASEENFAEKWNRADGEGESYKGAFYLWHAEALTDIALGLTNWGSQDAFVQEVRKKFGLPASLVEDITKEFNRSWTLPGRVAGETLNKLAASSFGFATGAAIADPNTVGRLG